VRGGLVWSHLLASILGGLVVAGVLLAFGVIGKQRTETVPVQYSSAPPASASGAGASAGTAQIYQDEGPAVVRVQAKIIHRVSSPFIAGTELPGATSTGSGFLVSPRGFILTTCHQIEGADFTSGITVDFNSQTARRAEVIDCQPADDVALLKVNMRGVSSQITPLSLGNSRDVDVGSSVLAIANPYGLERTLASGVVSALQRQLTAVNGMAVNDVVQTDLLAAPGSDGSPLMDDTGKVIGINSQIQIQGGGRAYAVSFAVPINTAQTVVPKGVLP
jgi:S1-C subfamily serine protease